MNFHPDDPTVWLWTKLLRSNPIHTGKKPPTKSEKKRMSERLRSYYVEHQHPRKGKPFSN